MVIKANLKKAYDLVDWNFLKELPSLLGFPLKFVSWIMLYVGSLWFSVNINGNLEGFFKSTVGLRQGDPLSPLPFTLVMEYFSRGLSRLFVDKKILSVSPEMCKNHVIPPPVCR